MEITNSYLMWIGSDSYPTIDDWANEAIEQGISKRLPNLAVAKAMVEPGTVVFVAHDEGEHVECPHCVGLVECPECRKRNETIAKVEKEIEAIKSKFDDFEKEAPRAAKRKVELRSKKLAALREENEDCAECAGDGEIETGTGGHVVLRDGTIWDYRRYTYWRNQPKKFDFRSEVVETAMCEHCGGRGYTPKGVIFGAFLPEKIEYIVEGGEDEKKLEAIKAAGAKKVSKKTLATELERKCGRRRPGGTYLVTTVETTTERAEDLVKRLVEDGHIEASGADVNGSFVRFSPISIDAKRFRGIARYSLDPDVEAEAELAIDELEGK